MIMMTFFILLGCICVFVLLVVISRIRASLAAARRAALSPDQIPPEERTLDEQLAILSRHTESVRQNARQQLDRYSSLTFAFDPSSSPVLERFLPIRKHSHCLFARSSRLWASRDWDSAVSLEENVRRSIPGLLQFTRSVTEHALDGFLFEIQTPHTNVEEWGALVRRLLCCVSEMDPAASEFMDSPFIAQRGWYPSFSGMYYFVTSFSHVYPSSHPRHTYGQPYGYVLFLPEPTFTRHKVPPHHADDDRIDTIRQRIRQLHRQNGRGYTLPNGRFFPIAPQVVRPLVDYAENVVEWWRTNAGDENVQNTQAA